MKLDLPQAFEAEASLLAERLSTEPRGPMPLPDLPQVPELSMSVLPDAFRDWIDDASDRARFRPDFAAATAMVCLGSVIGRKLGIRLKRADDWTEYANLWGAIVGQPSSLKSPAIREASRPLKQLQARADELHAAERADTEARQEAWRLRREARKKVAAKALSKDPDGEIHLGDDPMPEPSLAKAYWTANCNSASLGVLLQENPNGLLIERDEISSLLVGLENEQNADLRGLLLSGWSGSESYRFDRIARGTLTLPRYALSVMGGIQPGPLSRYVRSAFTGERADGLLQRFQMVVWPDQQSFEYVDRAPNLKAREAAAAVFERVDTLPENSSEASPAFINLNDEAQEAFVSWFTQFMQSQRQASQSSPLAAHFGKFPALLGKLCLILHCADEPDAERVSLRTIEKALAWLDYLEPHAQRVYHAAEHPETQAAELLLARLKRGELPTSFKAWEISRRGWHGLTDSKAVKRACRLLFEYGWLIERDDPEGKPFGRPSDPVYFVSPRIKL